MGAEATERALAAARRSIAAVGWRETTLQRIADEAGMSRMTLHRNGLTRVAIRDLLAAGLEAEHQAAVWPALTALGDGRTRLRAALSAQCAVTEAHLELLSALEDDVRDGVFHEAATDRGGVLSEPVFTEPLQRLLHDGIADGTLAPCDVEETATVLFNLVGWTYRHLRRGHGWSPDRARESVLRIALDGVGAGQASAARITSA